MSYTCLLSDCGGIFESEKGTFSSPNWPRHYHHHTNCIWNITVAKFKVNVCWKNASLYIKLSLVSIQCSLLLWLSLTLWHTKQVDESRPVNRRRLKTVYTNIYKVKHVISYQSGLWYAGGNGREPHLGLLLLSGYTLWYLCIKQC